HTPASAARGSHVFGNQPKPAGSGRVSHCAYSPRQRVSGVTGARGSSTFGNDFFASAAAVLETTNPRPRRFLGYGYGTFRSEYTSMPPYARSYCSGSVVRGRGSVKTGVAPPESSARRSPTTRRIFRRSPTCSPTLHDVTGTPPGA